MAAVHWKASQINKGFKRNDYGDLLRRMESIENKLDFLLELEFSKGKYKLSSHQLMFLKENYYNMSFEKLSEEMAIPIYKIKTTIKDLINRGILLKKYGYKDFNIDIF